jgi:Fe(3+) dicitrate transport protein
MRTLSISSVINLIFIALSISPCLSQADENLVDTVPKPVTNELPVGANDKEEIILNRITIAGTRDEVRNLAGSAQNLNTEELQAARGGFDDIGRVLGQVPGVNIQDEEGYGRRPNIGLRGTSVERSSSITLMEDSVLIAPAPYSAPAAYYFPPVGRMSGLEVIKGAGTIKYGPRTIGGSVNLFSTPIPSARSLEGLLAGGTDETLKGRLSFGESYRYGGFMLEGYQIETEGFKELDGGGDTGFRLRDLGAKIRLNTDANADYYQQLQFKIQDYDEDSNETYLGLTQADFDRNPLRRYRASQLDDLNVQNQQYHLRHYIELSDNLDVTTTLYRNNTQRAWYKLQSVGGNSLSNILEEPENFRDSFDWITGEQDSPENALVIRDNNRRYFSRGVQSIVSSRFETAALAHSLEFGARYHEDQENRFQRDDLYQMSSGRMILNEMGAPGSESNRLSDADAWAFYVQDEIGFDKFTLVPGLRYENIRFERRDFGKSDPQRLGTDLQQNRTSLDVFIPGLGGTYQINDSAALFGGIFKGFSPPGPGASDDVKEEESVNYEFGGRYNEDLLDAELVFFWNDYENLLGADTLAAGGEGTGDLFNAGEASARGLEAAVGYDFGSDLPVTLPAKLSYTYTKAEFDSSFDSELFGLVKSGDALPYIPRHQGALSIGIGHDSYGLLTLKGRYVDSMTAFAGEAGARPNASTDNYFVFDLDAQIPVTEEATFFVELFNVFDDEYVVARRPAGARPGLPFTALAGVKFALN